MSTRGLTGFVVDGVWKVTYNHSDSYPEGLGMEVLEFCKSVVDWDVLRGLVRKVVLVDNNYDVPKELRGRYDKFSDTSVSTESPVEWYCYLRKTQGVAGLCAIAKGELEHMIDSHNFMADSIFCEWAYVIDLDEMVLRVYKAVDGEPDPNNVLPSDIPYNAFLEGYDKTKFYPVKMLHAYSLYRLPKFMLGVTNEFKKRYLESIDK